jgi:hypothetical protein
MTTPMASAPMIGISMIDAKIDILFGLRIIERNLCASTTVAMTGAMNDVIQKLGPESNKKYSRTIEDSQKIT